MIPLSKPKLYHKLSSRKDKSIIEILKSLLPHRKIKLVFSARQGLDIIYQELYRKKGSCKVAVSPLTCFDALYPIINNKHTIVFVDINPDTFNMDEELIPKGVDVIQPIHFGGNPQNMDIIIQKSKSNFSVIVEDCAQAYGSAFNGVNLGNFGDYSSFSFIKNLYALGGGFIVSKEEINTLSTLKKSNRKLIIYRNLKRYIESKNSFNTFFSEIVLFNLLRLKPKDTSYIFSKNSIDSKMLRSINVQLNSSGSLVHKREKIAIKIRSQITNKNLVEQKIQYKGKSNYTRLFYKLKKGNSIEYINKLRRYKIWANHLSQNTLSNYQQSIYEITELKKYANSNSLTQYNIIHDKIISIPVSPALNEKEINYIIYHVNRL